jgi:hypothetical protein
MPGKVMIFSNFFFVKRMLNLVRRLSIDMKEKREMVLRDVENHEIRENIKKGFLYLEEVKKNAAEKMEEIRVKKLKRDQIKRQEISKEYSSLDLSVKIESPSIIIDEYLLGEPVLNPKMPCYFLIDMGKWSFKNHIYEADVEPLSENLEKCRENFDNTQDKETYEDLDKEPKKSQRDI